MANWTLPALTSSYTNFVTEVKSRDTDLALGFDPALVTPTNLPTNAIRWNSASFKWEKYNGTTWADLSARYAINIDGTVGATTPAAGAFTTLTLSGGTANGVSYLNASKVLTSGSALTFDGTNLGVGGASAGSALSVTKAKATAQFTSSTGTNGTYIAFTNTGGNNYIGSDSSTGGDFFGAPYSLNILTGGAYPVVFGVGNAEQMRLTSTGLGIGTSSPNEKLVVNGAVRARSNAVNVTASAGAVMDYFGGTARFFATDGAVAGQMSLDVSGNLGLGVTPSAWGGVKAIESGFGNFAGVNQFNGTANAWYNGGNWVYKNTAAATQYLQISGAHQWLTAPSGTAGNAITFTQALTLDASGRLGVGTTSPGAKLNVVGTTAGIGYLAGITLSDNATTTVSLGLQNPSGSDLPFVYGNSGLGFGTNSAERARIDSSGNLLVGTTTSAGKLTVSGSGKFTSALVETSTSELTYPTLLFSRSASFGLNQMPLIGDIDFRVNNGSNVSVRAGRLQVYSLNGSTSVSGFVRLSAFSGVAEDSIALGANTVSFSTSGNERASINSSGQFHTQDNAGNVTAAYDARAWVNFNGTGTVAIRASGNVSSITDNGTGDYTVNFTSAMSTANYAVSGMSEAGQQAVNLKLKASAAGSAPTLKSTTQVRVYSSSSTTDIDCNNASIVIHI